MASVAIRSRRGSRSRITSPHHRLPLLGDGKAFYKILAFVLLGCSLLFRSKPLTAVLARGNWGKRCGNFFAVEGLPRLWHRGTAICKAAKIAGVVTVAAAFIGGLATIFGAAIQANTGNGEEAQKYSVAPSTASTPTNSGQSPSIVAVSPSSAPPSTASPNTAPLVSPSRSESPSPAPRTESMEILQPGANSGTVKSKLLPNGTKQFTFEGLAATEQVYTGLVSRNANYAVEIVSELRYTIDDPAEFDTCSLATVVLKVMDIRGVPIDVAAVVGRDDIFPLLTSSYD